MPRETDHYTAILKKLQGVIKHTDHEIAAGRRLAIERWVKTYIRQVEYLKNGELQFLYNIFCDESCWLGTRLNNTILGQRFTEEKIGEIENPLSKYNMACRYCLVDKIHPFFQEKFTSYKDSVPSGAVDGDGNSITDRHMRNSLLTYIKSHDPVFSFWINKESGELEQYDNAVDGFERAVKFKWSEGVEYFYNRLKKEDKDKKITETILALSSAQSNQNSASILDFCVNNTVDKNALLDKLLQKDKVVYSLFSALIDWGFLDTVQSLVQDWFCKKEISVTADKIFSHKDYTLLLFSLSDTMLKSPALSLQARKIVFGLWGSGHFYQHKKDAVDTSNGIVPIKGVLAGLIVNWKRDGGSNLEERKEILDILSFAKDCFPEKFAFFKEKIIKNLKLVGREGMKEGVDYGMFAEELFSQLEKVPLPSQVGSDLRGSGDPQSILGAPGVSGFSGHSK